MNNLIRYSLCNDLKIQYFGGKISILPQKNIFSLNLKTGNVKTDIPNEQLKVLEEKADDLLFDNIKYKDAFEKFKFGITTKGVSDVNLNISLNERSCNMVFSNGIYTTFTQKVGRMALCKNGAIKYLDFSFSKDDLNICDVLSNTFNMINEQFKDERVVRSFSPTEVSNMIYILSPQAAAFFTHEVVGHIFEQDNWVDWKSKLDYNRAILPSCCTLVDDPTKVSYLKYGDYDDAGNKTHSTTIIKDGFFNEPVTLCRSAEYSQLPMPRMSNFSLLCNPNGRSFSKMCAAYKKYIVIEEISNGGFCSSTGDFFILSAKQFYVDSYGEKHNLSPSTYSGKINELCSNIIEVSNDIMSFIGICSKNRQNIFVRNAAPSIAVSGLSVLT